jgi:hypothetical protein
MDKGTPSMSTATIINRAESWPLIVVNVYGTSHSERAIDDAFASWVEFMKRGRHALIFDITEGNIAATPKDRARVAEWIAKTETLAKDRQIANVIVVKSVIARGFITAIFWLKPPFCPTFLAQDLGEAVDRAVGCLRDVGENVSAGAIATARRAGSRKNSLGTASPPER